MSIKKIIAGVIALAAVFAIVATASAQASYMFSANLTVGSRGADVVALQSFLESKGYLVMPVGVAKGYFGNATKASLASYQSAKGITPAVGYFGAITRATVNSDVGTVVSTTPGCSAGAMFSSVTGAPCTSTPVTPGCAAGALFNSQTGASCSSTGTPSTSTSEGTLNVTLSGTPSNNANIQTSQDVPVYGLSLRASISDVTVDRIDLKVQVLNGSSYENPSTLINTIKAWDGTNVIKTWSVGSADFIKDNNDSTIYYVRLSGLGFIVPNNTTKILSFSLSTNGGIDNDRTVTVQGYSTNSLRAVSGQNITSYYDISGSSFTRTQTFKKPGSATLTLTSDSSTPRSQNWRLNTTSGVTGVTVGTINVKSDTADSMITDVSTLVVASGTYPSVLYLYDGSTPIDSKAVPTSGTGTVSFHNLTINVAQDQTKTLTFKADMPSNTATSTAISAGASTTITYQKPNGSSATILSTGLSVYSQYFFSAAPQISFVSASAQATSLGNAASTTNINGQFIFTVKPVGGSMTAFASNGSDFVISTSTTGAALAGATSKSITVDSTDSPYAEGGLYTVTLGFQVPNSVLGATGLYTFYVNSIAWTTNGSTVTQTYGLQNYKTNVVSFTK